LRSSANFLCDLCVKVHPFILTQNKYGPKKMRKLTRLITIVLSSLLLLGFAIDATRAQSQAKGPLRKDQLVEALRVGGLQPGEYIQRIRDRGVDFELTPAIEKELRDAGATSEIIEAIRANHRCTPTAVKVTAGAIVKNSLGMDLVMIPAGTFCMGSSDHGSDERPLHEVTFKESFYMGRYEVTQAVWQKIMGENRSFFKDKDQLPVEQIAWDEAQTFIRKLNERKDGFTYRLPSEAEWEYACRAGTIGDFAGDANEMGWYLDNSEKGTHPVGQKKPNAFGLYDMHGNVWEWCQDTYHQNYKGAPSDGSAWVDGGEPNSRVLRGGSWLYEADLMRSAYRYGFVQEHRSYSLGMRVVAVKTHD
jgi:formylglycine-generating enzyme required for sulfatase activity